MELWNSENHDALKLEHLPERLGPIIDSTKSRFKKVILLFTSANYADLSALTQ
ncbi:hypothetical protein NBRC111893_696 [Lentilactobacillus kosonis]|uniref:Uncharacterized protein n=1 Tax=Lentilactobacillus kosonis TaxID=2810561 RepID=A0A401FJH7_9LACO|nr:hypothetical protein NBRC111893_696 [Lentilactobacillus kosonis]